MEGDALKLRHAAEGSGRNGRSIVIDVLDRRTVEEIGVELRNVAQRHTLQPGTIEGTRAAETEIT